MRNSNNLPQHTQQSYRCPVCGKILLPKNKNILPGCRIRCLGCGTWSFSGSDALAGSRTCCPYCGKIVKRLKGRCPSCHNMLGKSFWKRFLDLFNPSPLKSSLFRYVPVTQIRSNQTHPRRTVDTVKFRLLLKSIREYGILVPLVVCPRGNYFELISGHRRLTAAHKAGMNEVPVIIRNIQPEEAEKLRLLENSTHEQWTPLDFAECLEKICLKSSPKEQARIFDLFEINDQECSKRLNLLDLPELVKDALSLSLITEEEARGLAHKDEKEIFHFLRGKKRESKEIDSLENSF